MLDRQLEMKEYPADLHSCFLVVMIVVIAVASTKTYTIYAEIYIKTINC